MFLDPGKLLVIGVVALVVLGPDHLPKVAKTVGSFWSDFTRWRASVDAQVRAAFPDLPATHEIAAAVRSPLVLLDRLAQESEATVKATGPSMNTAVGVVEHPRPDASGAPTADPWDSWPGQTSSSPPVHHDGTSPAPVSPGGPIDTVSMN
jgi:Sec-independent protein translocase protein TatA